MRPATVRETGGGRRHGHRAQCARCGTGIIKGMVCVRSRDAEGWSGGQGVGEEGWEIHWWTQTGAEETPRAASIHTVPFGNSRSMQPPALSGFPGFSPLPHVPCLCHTLLALPHPRFLSLQSPRSVCHHPQDANPAHVVQFCHSASDCDLNYPDPTSAITRVVCEEWT